MEDTEIKSCFGILGTGSCYIAQVSFMLKGLLPQLPKCLNARPTPARLAERFAYLFLSKAQVLVYTPSRDPDGNVLWEELRSSDF